MPIVSKDRNHRLAFLFGRQAALRSTSDTVEQLIEQLKAEQAQHDFDNRYWQEQLALLSRELAEARYEIAKRDREKAFEVAPSPSGMVH
jgi:hypothetical protein